MLHQLQKMYSPNSERSNNSRHYKNKIIIKTTAPVSFLLLIFEGFMGVKFACPCNKEFNTVITLLILIVPAFFGWIMLSLFLRFEELSNSEYGGVQTDSRGRSAYEKLLDIMIYCIPSLLWFCIFFIDGDYLACLKTKWDGTYTCDSKIHTNCVSWCKPESNEGRNETQIFKDTQWWNNQSKKIGYILALVFCIVIGILIYFSEVKNIILRLWNMITMCLSKDRNRTSGPSNTEYNRETETALITNKSE